MSADRPDADDPDDTVCIVGGGLGGLLLAVELERRGRPVVVLEAGDGPGGVARTVHEDGWLLEPAASSLLLPNPALDPILAHVGIEPVPARPAASHRFLFTRGRLIELSPSPRALLAPVASPLGKLRAVAEPIVGRRPAGSGPDESVASFARRRLGREMGTLMSTVAAHGVFAGDPEELSVRSCFGSLPALEDRSGSLLRGAIAGRRATRAAAAGAGASPRVRRSVHVVAGGMGELADALAASLGDRFLAGRRVSALERLGDAGPPGSWSVRGDGWERTVRQVVLAVPAPQAAALVDPPLAALLSRARCAPVAVVGLGGTSAELPLPEGFGVLCGPGTGLRVLGVLFESHVAGGRAPAGHHLAKAILGGGADPEVMDLDDEELVATAAADLSRILSRPVRPSWTRVVRQPLGIPQYAVGHARWLAEVDRSRRRTDGLHLAGWSYRGVGVAGLADDARALADELVEM